MYTYTITYLYTPHIISFSLVEKNHPVHRQTKKTLPTVSQLPGRHLGKDSNAAIHGALASCPRWSRSRWVKMDNKQTQVV